jgi:hypothetical protein
VPAAEVHWALAGWQLDWKQATQAGPLPAGPHSTGHRASAHWLLMSSFSAWLGARRALQAQRQDGGWLATAHIPSHSAVVPQLSVPAG